MEFEWDAAKEARNVEKHGISFVAAAQVLESGTAFSAESDRGGERRWIAVGIHPATRKAIAVVYTERGGRCRIISARRAHQDEEEEYRRRIARRTSESPEGTQGDPG